MDSWNMLSPRTVFLFAILSVFFVNISLGEEFLITYWCGPPLKETIEKRYREIKEAGFNIAFVSIDGAFKKEDNLRLLDIAYKVGLRCIIADQRLTWDLPAKQDWQNVLDEVIKDYSFHPALYGYFLMDEPNSAHFSFLGKLVSHIKEKDPKHIAYINLFPDYATPEQLGTPTYREHIQQFIKLVKPNIVSYDYYTFLQGGDRETFFENLQVVREESEKAKVPFMVIIQLLTHGPYRDITKGEIAWQVLNCLAYGAKGISYFTYWTPPDDPVWHCRNGIITWEGERTAHYQEIKEVNKEVKVLGDFLNNLKSIGAFHIGEIPRGGKPLPEGAPISGVDGGNVTLGFFKDVRGTYYCLLVNMDYKHPHQLKVFTKAEMVQIFNTETRKWKVPKFYKEKEKRYFRLYISPGGGVLLRL